MKLHKSTVLAGFLLVSGSSFMFGTLFNSFSGLWRTSTGLMASRAQSFVTAFAPNVKNAFEFKKGYVPRCLAFGSLASLGLGVAWAWPQMHVRMIKAAQEYQKSQESSRVRSHQKHEMWHDVAIISKVL